MLYSCSFSASICEPELEFTLSLSKGRRLSIFALSALNLYVFNLRSSAGNDSLQQSLCHLCNLWETFNGYLFQKSESTFKLLLLKTSLKKFLKYTGYTLLWIIGFLLIYFLSAFTLSRMTVNEEKDAPDELAIYIKTNGVHTDIVVPVKNEQIDWSKEIKFSNTHLKDTTAAYVAFGWGDKGFYLQTPDWSDLKFSVAFKAAFALSTTAIHATFYESLTEGTSCRKIMISNEQYTRLINYISHSFQHDSSGHIMQVITDQNYNNADAFYEAEGRYNLFKTCNTWANTALKRSGQKACVWTIFDTGIFLKYE